MREPDERRRRCKTASTAAHSRARMPQPVAHTARTATAALSSVEGFGGRGRRGEKSEHKSKCKRAREITRRRASSCECTQQPVRELFDGANRARERESQPKRPHLETVGVKRDRRRQREGKTRENRSRSDRQSVFKRTAARGPRGPESSL